MMAWHPLHLKIWLSGIWILYLICPLFPNYSIYIFYLLENYTQIVHLAGISHTIWSVFMSGPWMKMVEPSDWSWTVRYGGIVLNCSEHPVFTGWPLWLDVENCLASQQIFTSSYVALFVKWRRHADLTDCMNVHNVMPVKT
jgi:hypothetical protein